MENDQQTVSENPQQNVPTGVGNGGAATATVGPNGPFPAELNHWNWGAFLLNWIWAIGNRVWIGLLVLLSIIPMVGPVISIVVMVILGIKGNEWAWKAKKWENVEHFKRVQKKWAMWGVILLVVSVVLSVLIGVFLASAISRMPIDTRVE